MALKTMTSLPRAMLIDMDDTILSAYGRPEIAWNNVAAEFADELGAITPQQVAAASVPQSSVPTRAGVDTSLTTTRRLWIQLASGPNSTALPEQFSRMKNRNRELFDGISGYVSEERGKARLLIGPFRNNEEATIFTEDLASVHIPAFTWTSQPGHAIRKLPSE